MDQAVTFSLAQWSDAPDAYRWLSLDRRGNWLLKGGRVSNPGIIAFINRSYRRDLEGRWFFQNGPQRVFVGLDYTPWVYRIAGSGADARVESHTGTAARALEGAWVDEAGSVLLLTEMGIGVIDDRDLLACVSRLRDKDGAPPAEEVLEQALEALQARAAPPKLYLHLCGARLPLGHLVSAEVPVRFGFVPHPVPAPGEPEC